MSLKQSFSSMQCISGNTLYVHGLTHIWDAARLPIQASDEAGESALRDQSIQDNRDSI